jgi:hypothetical protein
MKTLALTSAIAIALGASAAAYAGGWGHDDPKLSVDDSFNKSYTLDVTKTLDVDYRTKIDTDLGVAVAKSVLIGAVGAPVDGLVTPRSRGFGNGHGFTKASNTIKDSHTAGMSAISQNNGSNSLIQQSQLVTVGKIQ